MAKESNIALYIVYKIADIEDDHEGTKIMNKKVFLEHDYTVISYQLWGIA